MLIKLFGGLRISQNEQTLVIPRLRERTLFAYLLLHPTTAHSREKLIELLWPESDSERSGRNFANVLYRLQQVVGKQWIVAEGNGLRLATTATLMVDVWTFDQLYQQPTVAKLQEAAMLYAGDLVMPTANLLPEHQDDWLLPLQTHYHECFLSVLLQLGHLHEQAQQFDEAQRAYQRLRLNDPLNEEAYAGLMRAYARQGRLSEVTTCYYELAALLQQDLAATPSSTVRALWATLTRTPSYIEQPAAPVASKPATATQADQAIAHNFPKPLTCLIGRTQELDEIGRLLANHRLLTLTGAGGSGKTRLAIAVARELADTFEHGAWWIDLSPLTEEHLVAQTILQTLGLTPAATTAPVTQLIEQLAGQQCLLVLDNCEHLLPACATLIETLLPACDEVQILATSREPLGVASEMLWLTPTLAMPTSVARAHNGWPKTDDESRNTVTTLGNYAALQLFVERARSVRQDFQLTAENVGHVLEICQRLDGIPLAIELAAARIKVLPPAQLAQRLHDRFHLLVNPQRNSLPRQQTLQALIDWSYNLLNEHERRLLCRLAVFASGFSLEAAEAVCGEETLEALARLVDKSMVLFFERQGAARYRLLETIHAYAQQRLLESGEAERYEQAHLAFYLDLAEQAAPHLATAEQVRWTAMLELEQDNLRATLHRAIVQGLLPMALRIINALNTFWFVRGDYAEARAWIDQTLTLNTAAGATAQTAETQRLLAQALAHGGRFAFHQTDYANAIHLLTNSLALARTVDDHATEIRVLNTLGSVYLEQRRFVLAKQSYCASLQLAEATNNQPRMAIALNNLGVVTHEQGRPLEARDFYTKSLTLQQQLGDVHGITTAMIGLGRVATALHDYAAAEAHFSESLTRSRQLGNKRITALALSNLGDLRRLRQDWSCAIAYQRESVLLALDLGNGRLAAQFLVGLAAAVHGLAHHETAFTMLATACTQLTKLAARLDVPEQADYDRLLDQLEQLLSQPLRHTLWQRGQQLTVEQASALA